MVVVVPGLNVGRLVPSSPGSAQAVPAAPRIHDPRNATAHLGQVRHRAEVVEYRVEQHVAKLGERLAALNLGTSSDTTGLDQLRLIA